MKPLLIVFIFLSSILFAQDVIIKVQTKDFTTKTIQVGEINFSIRPLFKNKLGKNWYIASAKERVTTSPWDLAHQICSANEEIVYAEPDKIAMNEHYKKLARALTSANQAQRGYDKDWGHPDPDIFAWHLEDTHGQLKRARKEAAHKNGRRIRVAHFDTGYSPINMTTPEFIRTDLQRNFVKGEDPNSAVDPGKEGLFEQPGHGTSTLSGLAGNLVDIPEKKFKDYLGGAPEVEIVPVRLSKTVILLQVSVFAQALFYAVEKECDVVSMSMGGVASKLWAEAVNEAYEKGVTIVTAAGNNVLRLPTHYLVYPAKFKRVIAACGVNYDHKPYFKEDPWFIKMQGNWGPEKIMKSAIAAYTPNVPAGKFKKPNKLGNGGGTSAATPQVAATVALWLQKYKTTTYKHPWQKVNAVRHAVFSSARKDHPNSKKYFGNGTIRAADALKIAPKLDEKPIAKDSVFLPYLSVLFGWETLRNSNKDMITIEMAQLEQANPELRKLLEKLEGKKSISKELKAQIVAALKKIPETSKTLLGLSTADDK